MFWISQMGFSRFKTWSYRMLSVHLAIVDDFAPKPHRSINYLHLDTTKPQNGSVK